jgi:hypothetical protein
MHEDSPTQHSRHFCQRCRSHVECLQFKRITDVQQAHLRAGRSTQAAHKTGWKLHMQGHLQCYKAPHKMLEHTQSISYQAGQTDDQSQQPPLTAAAPLLVQYCHPCGRLVTATCMLRSGRCVCSIILAP